MSKAFAFLLLSALLAACAPLSEADIQATGTAARKIEAVKTNEAVHETVVAKTAEAQSTNLARRTQAASLPPMTKLEQVCQGNPVPEAGAYRRDTGIHPVYFAGHNAHRSAGFNQSLHSEWKPRLISEVQLVVCFEDLDEVVEVCKYGLASGFTQVRITRHRSTLVATLYEAKTGKRIDEHRFEKTARDCPPSTTIKNDAEYRPDDFEYDDIIGWVAKFISP